MAFLMLQMNRGYTPISFLLSVVLLLAGESDIGRADRLFAGRDNPELLKQAILLLEDSLARDPSNYEVLWRLAKFRYYLSDRQTNETARVELLEAGINSAKKAVGLDNQRPEGHFWLGSNYGDYADSKGPFKSLGLIRSIRREFEAVLGINPAYENGNVLLALGEMDMRLPRLLGGDRRRGLSLLESGLKLGPKNADLHLTLAETYLRIGRREEGKKLLRKVLSLDDPDRTAAEQEGIRSKARRLLDKSEQN